MSKRNRCAWHSVSGCRRWYFWTSVEARTINSITGGMMGNDIFVALQRLHQSRWNLYRKTDANWIKLRCCLLESDRPIGSAPLPGEAPCQFKAIFHLKLWSKFRSSMIVLRGIWDDSGQCSLVVGGLEHFFFPLSWEYSSQLTNSWFFRGIETTNHIHRLSIDYP